MSVLLEIEILRFLLFLNQNRNSQNSPKRMHPQFPINVLGIYMRKYGITPCSNFSEFQLSLNTCSKRIINYSIIVKTFSRHWLSIMFREWSEAIVILGIIRLQLLRMMAEHTNFYISRILVSASFSSTSCGFIAVIRKES